jgi:hypothetical protein
VRAPPGVDATRARVARRAAPRRGAPAGTRVRVRGGHGRRDGRRDVPGSRRPRVLRGGGVVPEADARPSKERLRGAFDLMRCKARARCGVVDVPPGAGNGTRGGAAGPPAVRVTLLLRRGARAFKDEAAVRRVFEKECARVAGCVVTTAHTDNLTFCDQVCHFPPPALFGVPPNPPRRA